MMSLSNVTKRLAIQLPSAPSDALYVYIDMYYKCVYINNSYDDDNNDYDNIDNENDNNNNKNKNNKKK